MSEPFDVFWKKEHPDGCQVCLGGGKLRWRGPITGGICATECTVCDGTGKSDAPLFTDEDSTAFDEWDRLRKLTYCPKCHRELFPEEIETIISGEDWWCRHCDFEGEVEGGGDV